MTRQSFVGDGAVGASINRSVCEACAHQERGGSACTICEPFGIPRGREQVLLEAAPCECLCDIRADLIAMVARAWSDRGDHRFGCTSEVFDHVPDVGSDDIERDPAPPCVNGRARLCLAAVDEHRHAIGSGHHRNAVWVPRRDRVSLASSQFVALGRVDAPRAVHLSRAGGHTSTRCQLSSEPTGIGPLTPREPVRGTGTVE